MIGGFISNRPSNTALALQLDNSSIHLFAVWETGNPIFTRFPALPNTCHAAHDYNVEALHGAQLANHLPWAPLEPNVIRGEGARQEVPTGERRDVDKSATRELRVHAVLERSDDAIRGWEGSESAGCDDDPKGYLAVGKFVRGNNGLRILGIKKTEWKKSLVNCRQMNWLVLIPE